MLICDGHLDLAWNALQWNRDLQASIQSIRLSERHMPGAGRGQGTVSLPELVKGRVALCFATLIARSTGHPVEDVDYSSPAQAYGIAQGQLAYYRALQEMEKIRLITGLTELDDHIGKWQRWEQNPQSSPPPIGVVISMESADPILTPAQLGDWKNMGLRIIGPAHYGVGRYAGGTSSEDGLTALGIELLAEMERLGIILDVTHLSDQAFWQALDRFDGPILASHNNCRALVSHQRQFSDDQLRAVSERGGVIGAACDNWMLQPGWVRGGTENHPVYLTDVVNHIDHICQLTGDSEHVAIGSDLDGGYGREQSPADLDTIADLQKLVDILDARGYREEDINNIMHENWLRLLHRAWV
jgi:membrane dipeptidase